MEEKVHTITIEAIADNGILIRHAFFGIAGCNNDTTVFKPSPSKEFISRGISM